MLSVRSTAAPLATALAVCAASLLVACAAKPPKPVEAKTTLAASADVNPDSTGRPSPIVVRVFQLRGDAEFNGADFFALYDKEKETLGASLILREEFVMQPGESREVKLPISLEARFLGVVAAYRDIRAAHWRAISAAPEKKLIDMVSKDHVTIRADKAAVTLAIKD
jgi:type VI secretion system protein VasD